MSTISTPYGGPNHGTLANGSEMFQQQFPPLRNRCAKRRVVAREPLMRRCHVRLKLGRARVVQILRQPRHLKAGSARLLAEGAVSLLAECPLRVVHAIRHYDRVFRDVRWDAPWKSRSH
jgi:hypothetical protein